LLVVLTKTNAAKSHAAPQSFAMKTLRRKKMKGYVAVQRKMLILIYTLWKKNEAYNPSIKFLEQPVEAALTELD
jgi:hypothetical protein